MREGASVEWGQTARSRRELEPLSAHWQRALDAADSALQAATGSVPDADLRERRQHLVRERQETARLLEAVAQVARPQPKPWLSPVPVRNAMLGLPRVVHACIFDLERVLTDSAAAHAWAWGESSTTSCCVPRSRRAGTSFPSTASPTTGPASTDARDSKASMRFCGAAGSGSPKAWTDDSPGTETANGLANRKGAMLANRLRERGVTESLGARRYLEAAHRAGVKCAAISASANTSKVLELSELAALIDVRIDAEVMESECLRSLPAPDVLLAVCRRLDVLPAETATFTSSPAGVAAGRSAGLAIIGVADANHAELLAGFGAERVVPSLRTLLDPRLLGNDDVSCRPTTRLAHP